MHRSDTLSPDMPCVRPVEVLELLVRSIFDPKRRLSSEDQRRSACRVMAVASCAMDDATLHKVGQTGPARSQCARLDHPTEEAAFCARCCRRTHRRCTWRWCARARPWRTRRSCGGGSPPPPSPPRSSPSCATRPWPWVSCSGCAPPCRTRTSTPPGSSTT
jgi:hypothetical protein